MSTKQGKRPRINEIEKKIAEYLVFDLRTRYSVGLKARDAVEVIWEYMNSEELETARERLKSAGWLVSAEHVLVFDRLINLMLLVHDYSKRSQPIPIGLIEMNYRSVMELLDPETVRIIEEDKFSPRRFMNTDSVPPSLHEALMLSIYRMKDVIISRYITKY